MRKTPAIGLCLALWLIGPAALVASAQPNPPPASFGFATIGDAGNAPYTGADPWNLVSGRGGVGYDYRIGRSEVTTAEWMEFVNTYTTQGGSWTWFSVPTEWGAERDPTYSGPGQRFRLSGLPDAERIPVRGMSWRSGAMYCNWLHNGKDPGTWALQDGAYDASTFTTNANGTYNDQWTRHPGARYWIPSLDEWLKAAYYDPNHGGQGVGGWWLYPNGSDVPLIGGLPGQGQSLAGVPYNFNLLDIPLGSYPDVQSPWGLIDLSGISEEWLEEVVHPNHPRDRGTKGSPMGLGKGFELSDRIYSMGSLPAYTYGGTTHGLRIAAAVPSPSGILTLCCVFGLNMGRGRRKR